MSHSAEGISGSEGIDSMSSEVQFLDRNVVVSIV